MKTKQSNSSADKGLLWLALAVLGFAVMLKLLMPGRFLAVPPEPVTLVFAEYWDEAVTGLLETTTEGVLSLAAEFEETHPGVKVQVRPLSFDTIESALFATNTSFSTTNTTLSMGSAALSDAAPAFPTGSALFGSDIVSVEGRWLAPLGEAGLSAGTTAAAAFMRVFYYNIPLLTEAGFIKPPKTDREVEQVCKKALEAGAQGIAFASDRCDSLLPWLFAAGVSKYADIEDSGIAGNLVKSGLISADQFTRPQSQIMEEFTSGNIFVVTASLSWVNRIKKSGLNFALSAVPQPSTYLDAPGFVLETWYAAALASSAHPEEAAEFLAFLAERRGHIAAWAGAVPGDIYTDPSDNGNSASFPRGSLHDKARELFAGGDYIAEEDIVFASTGK